MGIKCDARGDANIAVEGDLVARPQIPADLKSERAGGKRGVENIERHVGGNHTNPAMPAAQAKSEAV